jgi:hypothetical protein
LKLHHTKEHAVQHKKVPSKRRLTNHHRKPRVFNGVKSKHNISRVPRNQHEAFHTLFAWAHPAEMVAQILNARWLCHSEVLVPVPTQHLPKVLEFLASLECRVEEERIGITDVHRSYYAATT